jgi:hypothetical protein
MEQIDGDRLSVFFEVLRQINRMIDKNNIYEKITT